MSSWEQYRSRFPVNVDIGKFASVIDAEFIIVIPSFNEPSLEHVLNSLAAAKQPNKKFAVILVLNHGIDVSENIKALHEQQMAELNSLRSSLPYKLILANAFNIKSNKAGVGYARKYGMDLAAFLLSNGGNEERLIICLDADCSVSNNYLVSIEKHSELKPLSVSFAFAHPFEHLPQKHKEGIIQYELFLRYYLIALQSTGFPYCAYTIGSAMGVSAQMYMKCGGMNQRKAGEDFYFLNKVLAQGQHLFIKDAYIIPSPRLSERVPFGTGRSMKRWMEDDKHPGISYSLACFEQIKIIIDYFRENDFNPLQEPKDRLMPVLLNYLVDAGLKQIVYQLQTQAKDLNSRRKRFFQWMDAFLIMKCLNLLYNAPGGQSSVLESLRQLHAEFRDLENYQAEEMLYWLREKEKRG